MHPTRYGHSNLKRALTLVLPLALVAFAACGGDDDGMQPEPDYSLTFSGDASFQGAHGGQDVHVVVETEAGTQVASDDGTVSGSADPSFSFDFGDVLESGESYVIRYWIDSNFGGGTVGSCDAPSTDHQWHFDSDDDADLTAVAQDLSIEDSHRPTDIEDVCDSF